MCRGPPRWVVARAGLVAIQPGVLRGQVDRLEEAAIDVDVQGRRWCHRHQGVGWRTGLPGVGAGPGRELDVAAGRVEGDGIPAGRLTGEVPEGPVRTDDRGAATEGGVLGLVHVVGQIRAPPDEQRGGGAVLLICLAASSLPSGAITT